MRSREGPGKKFAGHVAEGEARVRATAEKAMAVTLEKAEAEGGGNGVEKREADDSQAREKAVERRAAEERTRTEAQEKIFIFGARRNPDATRSNAEKVIAKWRRSQGLTRALGGTSWRTAKKQRRYSSRAE